MEIGQLNGGASTADDLVLSMNLEIRLLSGLLTGSTGLCFDDDLTWTYVTIQLPSLSEG